MNGFRWILPLVLLTPVGTVHIAAQTGGTLDVSGRVTIERKAEKLTRKRFYLFRGGLDSNKALVDKLKAANITSRDCFFCSQKTSTAFIAWLKAEDCESPYCRSISTEDTANIPEFQAAYQKTLRQVRNRPAVAQKWLTINLAPNLRDGYYRQRKSMIETLLGGLKPVQTSMTDSVSVRAAFIDIPLKNADGKATETFLVSNLIPFEVGTKSYLWACEVEIGNDKKIILPLKVPETGKTIKNCEVIVKDLPVCTAGVCAPK